MLTALLDAMGEQEYRNDPALPFDRVGWEHEHPMTRRCFTRYAVARLNRRLKRAARYDQCDQTCTVDCGHCKGQHSLIAAA